MNIKNCCLEHLMSIGDICIVLYMVNLWTNIELWKTSLCRCWKCCCPQVKVFTWRSEIDKSNLNIETIDLSAVSCLYSMTVQSDHRNSVSVISGSRHRHVPSPSRALSLRSQQREKSLTRRPWLRVKRWLLLIFEPSALLTLY